MASTAALPDVMRHEIAEQNRFWRTGYEAGLREHRRLLIAGIVVGAFVLLRRHIHPLVALMWIGFLVVVLAPVVALALAVTVTVRTHRSWRSWRRTLAMVVSWALAFALIAAVVEFAWPALVLAVVPVGAIAWAVDHHVRTRRALRFIPPPPPPFD